MLVDHYENKRLLVRSCFSSFTALQKMKNESAGDLKRIFHGMLSAVGTQKSVGRPINKCTDLFVHLVEMLNPRSRREWETSISGMTESPSYETLKTFLECRMRTLEALHPTKSEPTDAGSNKAGASARSVRSHLTQRAAKKGGRCSLCQGNHYVLFCSDFQKKKPMEKKEFAESKQLCLNCFGKH